MTTLLAAKYENWRRSRRKLRKLLVSLDFYFFRRHRWRQVMQLTDKDKFTAIYKYNLWNNEESLSGGGSTLNWTENVRARLPELVRDNCIESVIDAGCGDFNWMKEVQLGARFTGIDIVKDVVAENQARYGRPGTCFLELDITADELPRADLVICRQCLFHLSYAGIFAALRNFKRSGSRYLLATHFPRHVTNADIESGSCRALNLERPPFNFPRPLQVIDEPSGQCLALWRIADINVAEPL